jgi:aminoglycoside phosphotransferase family enzyme/predicted kinase
MTGASTNTFIRSLLRAVAYLHNTADIRYLETHISWVLLTGPYAYKIKKPLKLGFLDFSTVELRKHFCDEELRLNRRWAPELYLGVVEIRGSRDAAAIEGIGPLIDYAVKMKQFPQSARLDAQLAAGTLDGDDMRSLAAMLAAKHRDADVKTPDILDSVSKPMLDNFDDIAKHYDQALLHSLKAWTVAALSRLQSNLDDRRDHGFIRECHGDLHLANLVRLDSGITAFDCVEFSAKLRDIDVISDVAFLVMDLVARQRDDLAYVFLNRYLECSGDYQGMQLFDLYFVYHCLIRAKIAVIRGSERSNPSEAKVDEDELLHYLAVAKNCVSRPPPIIIAMHGLSGSGKTWLSDQLLRALPAVRVRSDIERKRIHGYGNTQSSGSAVGQGIYTDAASVAVHERLADITAALVASGHNTIIDASFLKLIERDRIRKLANRLKVSFVMIDTHASKPELLARLQAREIDASEADVDVLQHQLESTDPLTSDERRTTISIHTEAAFAIDACVRQIRDKSEVFAAVERPKLNRPAGLPGS